MHSCPPLFHFPLMTNDTDLANHALALIGEAQITAITDTSSKEARVCLEFADAARRETLRMGRWNCATKRASLVEILPVPVAGYAHQYQLPTDWLRMMDINGEAVKETEEYFEIEGRALLIDAETVWIRYVRDIGIGACDPLLQSAIAVRLASKIAIPISGRLEQADAMETLFHRRLAEAQGIDSKESAGADNPAWEKIFGRSRTLRARGAMRNPLRIEG